MGYYNKLNPGTTPLHEQPYSNQNLNNDYNLLFCDSPEMYKNDITIPYYPWDILFSGETPNENLAKLALNETLDTRPRLVACNILGKTGFDISARHLMGMIIEIRQRNGLDVLAVYKDGSARYIHHTENIIVWETQTQRSLELINALFNFGRKAFDLAASVSSQRISPSQGRARVSFLGSTGLMVKEDGFIQLRNDPAFGALIETALGMMLFLTEQKQHTQLKNGKNVFC